MDIEGLFDCGVDEGRYRKVTNQDLCELLDWSSPEAVLLSLLDRWEVMEGYSVLDALYHRLTTSNQGGGYEKTLFYLKNISLNGLSDKGLRRWQGFVDSTKEDQGGGKSGSELTFDGVLSDELRDSSIRPDRLFEDYSPPGSRCLWRKYYALTDDEFFCLGLRPREEAVCYPCLEDPEEDAEKAIFERLEERANSGDRDAQFDLGIAHINGSSCLEKNFKLGWELITKAAQRGHDMAKEAIQNSDMILRMKASEGDMEAQFDLGRTYLREGQPYGHNFRVAMDLIARSAVQGHPEASGLLYQALADLELAASDGNSDAQYNLGMAYMEGRYPLTRDLFKGRELLEKASASGNTQARDALNGMNEARAVDAFVTFDPEDKSSKIGRIFGSFLS